MGIAQPSTQSTPRAQRGIRGTENPETGARKPEPGFVLRTLPGQVAVTSRTTPWQAGEKQDGGPEMPLPGNPSEKVACPHFPPFSCPHFPPFSPFGVLIARVPGIRLEFKQLVRGHSCGWSTNLQFQIVG